MRKRNHKIKRHRNIYGTGKGKSPFLLVFMIIGIFVVAFIGWNLYPPIYRFIMSFEDFSFSDFLNDDEEPSTTPPPESLVVSEPEQENNLSSEESIAPTLTKSIYIPDIILKNDSDFNAVLELAEKAGCTEVIIDAKDSTGMVLFTSTNDIALRSAAVMGNAFDAKIIAQKISDAGLTPIAKIHAFRDNQAPLFDSDMAVSYYDSEYVWLDDSPELGGRRWLNPYLDKSRAYIKDISLELAQAGFKKIIIDSLSFPVGVGLEKAGYGETDGQSRSDLLTAFVKELEAELNANNAQAIIGLSAAFFTAEETAFYPSVAMIEVSNDNSDNGYIEIVGDAYNMAKSTLGEDTDIYFNIKSSKSDGSPMAFSELDAVAEAAFEIGAIGCMFYNSQGSYYLN